MSCPMAHQRHREKAQLRERIWELQAASSYEALGGKDAGPASGTVVQTLLADAEAEA